MNDQPAGPSREMSPNELKEFDLKLETMYKRQLKFGGYRASIAKNDRDEAVFTQEALAARMQTHMLKGNLKQLAEKEGIALSAEPEKATPSGYETTMLRDVPSPLPTPKNPPVVEGDNPRG